MRGGRRAVAECADGATWFVYDPELTHDGLWSLTREEPPELTINSSIRGT